MHITDPERRRWIQERLEGPQPAVDQEHVLDQLIRADLFEQVLQQRYLGSKRFSLEGVTALIPLVDEILEAAGQRGAVELVMGMSHRGRLNVIVQVAQRAAEEIFAGFEDVDPRSVLGSGDVKYHMGATGEYVTRSGAKIHIHLVSNPSHLEAVDPVTVGRTRAKQDRAGEDGDKKFVPLLVHGDAAFAGQGIVAETLNFADLKAYTVGGTVHIIANNLLGFTTLYNEEHSSRFSAQLARRQSIPIFHVNAEDVDAVVRVGRLAAEYRYTSSGDVVVDLIGYRRHGHSEVDDPDRHPAAALQSDQGSSAVVGDLRRGHRREDVQQKVEKIRDELEDGTEQRPRRSGRSPCCANCRAIGMTTRVVVTSRNMKWTLGSPRKNSPRLPRGLRLIPRISTSIPRSRSCWSSVPRWVQASAWWITAWRRRWRSAAW